MNNSKLMFSIADWFCSVLSLLFNLIDIYPIVPYPWSRWLVIFIFLGILIKGHIGYVHSFHVCWIFLLQKMQKKKKKWCKIRFDNRDISRSFFSVLKTSIKKTITNYSCNLFNTHLRLLLNAEKDKFWNMNILLLKL